MHPKQQFFGKTVETLTSGTSARPRASASARSSPSEEFAQMLNELRESRSGFAAFSNAFVGLWLHKLSGNAVKVLHYIVRWTLGCGRMSALISKSDFSDGTVINGVRHDNGCGLKITTIRKYLDEISEAKLVLEEKVTGRGGQLPNRYTILPAFWRGPEDMPQTAPPQLEISTRTGSGAPRIESRPSPQHDGPLPST